MNIGARNIEFNNLAGPICGSATVHILINGEPGDVYDDGLVVELRQPRQFLGENRVDESI